MTDDDVKLPEPIGYMNAGQAHELMHTQDAIYGYVYSAKLPHVGASVAVHDEPTVRRLIAQAKAEEREACARLAEREYYRDCKAAVAIRNRSKA